METPQLRYLTIPILLCVCIGAFLGAVFGWGDANVRYFVGGGMVAGFIVGWRMAEQFMEKLRKWNVLDYSSETVSAFRETTARNEHTTVINVNIDNKTYSIGTSLTEENWGQLALAVTQTGNFTIESCKLAFGATDGPRVYHLIREKLFSAGILENYGNGYKVTGGIGWHFWQQLNKGDVNLLHKLPELR